jgi:hypothetical protein
MQQLCHVFVCSLLLRLVAYVKAVVRSFISSEIHVRASVSRRFYWTELCAWPEDLPAGSTVLLSGKVSKATSLCQHCPQPAAASHLAITYLLTYMAWV